MGELKLIWDQCLNSIKKELNDEVRYDTFYKNSKLIRFENGTATILVDLQFMKSVLMSNRNMIIKFISQYSLKECNDIIIEAYEVPLDLLLKQKERDIAHEYELAKDEYENNLRCFISRVNELQKVKKDSLSTLYEFLNFVSSLDGIQTMTKFVIDDVKDGVACYEQNLCIEKERLKQDNLSKHFIRDMFSMNSAIAYQMAFGNVPFYALVEDIIDIENYHYILINNHYELDDYVVNNGYRPNKYLHTKDETRLFYLNKKNGNIQEYIEIIKNEFDELTNKHTLVMKALLDLDEFGNESFKDMSGSEKKRFIDLVCYAHQLSKTMNRVIK